MENNNNLSNNENQRRKTCDPELIEYIKNSIEYLKSDRIESQDEINDMFYALMQSTYDLLGGTIIDKLPNTVISDEQAQDLFMSTFSNNAKLQNEFILLAPKLQYNLMKCPKKIINCGTFTHDNPQFEDQVVNFTYLLKGAISADKENKNCYFVNTIKFSIPRENYDEVNNLINTNRNIFEQLLNYKNRNIRVQDLNAIIDKIYSLADRCHGFSFHQYYLPYGPKITNENKSVLIYRYDHTFDKHKNTIVPNVYQNIYLPEVCEPHFHFPTTFGSLYKIKRSLLPQDVSVGYAIGTTRLKNYINELIEDSNPNNYKFDYGMPFNIKTKNSSQGLRYLHRLSSDLGKLEASTQQNNMRENLRNAIQISNDITNVQPNEILLSRTDESEIQHSME